MDPAVGAALIAAVAAVASAWSAHRSAKRATDATLAASEGQQESARRTEHGINFRWACENAASDDPNVREMGVAVLAAMLNHGELTEDERRLALAAGKALLRELTRAYPEEDDDPPPP